MAILVNGERVSDERIRAEVMRRREHAAPDTPADAIEAEARNDVVGEVLLRQRARELDLPVSDEEVRAEIERAVLDFGGREAFCQRFGFQGLDDERLLAQARENVSVRKLIQRHADAVEDPTEDEAKAFFEEHREAYRLPERIRVSHIVKRPQGPGAQQGEGDPAVYAELQEARKRLRAGGDFAEEANRLSECSEEPGGDLGLIRKGQMVEAFDAVAFSLEEGEVSPVFMTQFGYHIATVTGRESARDRTFDEAKANILGRLRAEREAAARRTCIEALREDATIEEVEEPADGPAPSGQGFGPRDGKGKGKRKGRGKGRK